MSADFSKIKNPKIVELLNSLPYLEIMPDEVKQGFIDKIVQNQDTKEETIIQTLEKQVASLPKLTEEEKVAIFEGETENLKLLTKNFKKETLQEEERSDTEESQKTQDQLLKELDNL